jgi:hypothetical protein
MVDRQSKKVAARKPRSKTVKTPKKAKRRCSKRRKHNFGQTSAVILSALIVLLIIILAWHGLHPTEIAKILALIKLPGRG